MRQTLAITMDEGHQEARPPRWLAACKWTILCELFLRLGIVFYAAISTSRELNSCNAALKSSFPPSHIFVVTLIQTGLSLVAMFHDSLFKNVNSYFKLAFFVLVTLCDIALYFLLILLFICAFPSTDIARAWIFVGGTFIGLQFFYYGYEKLD